MGRNLSLFPHVDFDLSFRVDADLPAADLVEVTVRAAGDLLERSRVFDEFRDPSLGEGKKALAIRYRLRAPDRTLTADEIGVIRGEMISAAISVGGELRGA
jgi:phenylalanyl-tRNA synthetase beta chain